MCNKLVIANSISRYRNIQKNEKDILTCKEMIKEELCVIKNMLEDLFSAYDVSVRICPEIERSMILSADKFSREFFKVLNKFDWEYDIVYCKNASSNHMKLELYL